MESFFSIQGEGYHQGKPAYFIRLAGCDVGCHWCDVKESWEVSADLVIKVDKIVDDILIYNPDIVIVTGGEPLIYNLEYLCKRLHEYRFRTHLETSGAYSLTGDWDWICVSPKKFKKPFPGMVEQADELKVIVYNKSDFEWAKSFLPMVNDKCRLYLQPEWSRSDMMIPEVIDFVKENTNWSVSLQIHKYMNIP